jgi:tripartite-type tricarboxylate transporter receptor subunit TctC
MVAKGGMDKMSKEAIKDKIVNLLKDNNFTEVFESGDLEVDDSAGAALKAVLSEKAAEYAARAIRIAKKKGIKFGAAAVIIATRREK